MCTCYLQSCHKRYGICSYLRHSHRFPLELSAVNHLHNTLSIGTNLSFFNACHWKRCFTLSLEVINDNWSFHLSILLTDDKSNYFKFLRNHQSYLFHLACSTLFTLLWIVWRHCNSSLRLSKVKITEDKVMESVCAPEMMDGRTYSCGPTFSKCWTVRNAGW